MNGMTLGELRAELDKWVRRVGNNSIVKLRLGSDTLVITEVSRGRPKNVEFILKETNTQEPPPTIAEIQALALIIREERPVVAHSIHDAPPICIPFVDMDEHSMLDEEEVV